MSDLLIQGPPAILVNGSNPDNKPKASHQHTASALKKKVRAQKHVTIQPLSRILRGASDYVLALRDGLTTSEREDQRRVEERMEYLAQRMQNVGCVLCLRLCRGLFDQRLTCYYLCRPRQ